MTSVSQLLPLVVVGLLPFVLLATTSFVKLSVVFSVLRNALGTGQVPSGLVITILAAVLTGYVMLPVFRDAAAAAGPQAALVDWDAPLSAASRPALERALAQGSEPLRAFWDKHAGRSERQLFVDLKKRALPEAERAAVSGSDTSVVLPAFFVTELAEAFQIAFLLLLPFVVVDLVVASLLVSLGMQALSPTLVSLPLKLLLFVSVDGFRTLIEALLAGYA
jgi:type III secretion protein R